MEATPRVLKIETTDIPMGEYAPNLDEEQMTALTAMVTAFAEYDFAKKPFYSDDNHFDMSELHRCLKGKAYNVDVAVAQMKEALAFRDTYLPIKFDEVLLELRGGLLTIDNVDSEGCPIVHFHTKNLPFKTDPHDYELQVRAFAYLLYHVTFPTMKNGVERITAIWDRTDLSRTQVDINFLKRLIEVFQVTGPERLKNLHVYPVGTFFYGIWALVSPLLEANTREKVQLHRNIESLSEYFSLDKLDKNMGGEAELPEFDADAEYPIVKANRSASGSHTVWAGRQTHTKVFIAKDSTVKWTWSTTNSADVTFKLVFHDSDAAGGGEPVEVVNDYKAVGYDEANCSFTAASNGILEFVWDNSYSWRAEKNVTYEITSDCVEVTM